MRSGIPCNTTVVRTVALVNCLVRLHNFGVDEVERCKQFNFNKEALPIDIEHMMNKGDGYVPLVRDDNHEL